MSTEADQGGGVSLDRREFFRILGGGLAVGIVLTEVVAFEEFGGRPALAQRDRPRDIGSWLHIGADGNVTVFTGKVEVGQNIRTSLSQVVSEELRVPMVDVSMVMGDTDLTPYDRGTFGSRTTPIMSAHLRRVAAAARELLLDMAAGRWDVDRAELTIADGRVSDRSGNREIGIGPLVDGQELVRLISEADPLTEPGDWSVAGESILKVNGRELVTGAHRYPSDIKVEGMLHGKVLRPPSFGARLATVDASQAETIAGVTVVRDGDFVGVAAPGVETASAAISAIRAEWTPSPQPAGSELYGDLRNTVEGAGGGRSARDTGSIDEGLAAADERLEATYRVAYIAHVPLEPRAAVASWADGRLTVWTGTQRPFGVRTELAEAFGLPEEQVRVIMPDTGSAYGGKHSGDAALEAARLARVAGKPVKLVWTREEEFTWAYFRPAGVIDVSSGARADGMLTAWEFHNYNSGSAAIETPYDVANQRIRFHRARYPLRQGSYRGLAATANHFARETHMDELAHVLGLDPLELRLRNLTDERLRAVAEAAAERFGWERRTREPNRGAGLAAGFEKGSYVATCAEVAVDPDDGQVNVDRIVAAFECGAIVNPNQLTNQVEGAIVQGIGGALFEAIEFDRGKILNASFSGYRVPRFSDIPEIETVLLNRTDLPSAGAGETPIVGVAPAIGNAIFAATGTRLRNLPLAPDGIPT